MAAAVDSAALREAIGKLLPSKDLSTTSIKALREELEEVLGLGTGGLDAQRELVRDLLQEEICSIQQQREIAERPKRAQLPKVDLDAPLVALASVEVGDESTESSEPEDLERKKAKRVKRLASKRARAAPTPLRQRGAGGAATAKRKIGGPEGKASRFKSQVEKAVEQYISQNLDSWTISEMREDVAVRNGWENDTRLASMVKTTLFDLGHTTSGANVLKGAR